jgi:hypothetical protein
MDRANQPGDRAGVDHPDYFDASGHPVQRGVDSYAGGIHRHAPGLRLTESEFVYPKNIFLQYLPARLSGSVKRRPRSAPRWFTRPKASGEALHLLHG